MHLTRPKSSKGRSRAAVSDSPCSGDAGCTQRPDRHPRCQSQPIMWPASQLSQDGGLQMLQPAAPPLSLNKYKVLPSIGGRRSGVSPGRSLSGDGGDDDDDDDDDVLQQRQRHQVPDLHTVMDGTKTSSSEVDKRTLIAPDPGAMKAKEAGSLLLAIRAPCGRRFQQHFEPTDTLLMVRASAELRYEAEYGEASIQTVDVPRRTFTDMEMSLAQCGILNRSVLCISQN